MTKKIRSHNVVSSHQKINAVNLSEGALVTQLTPAKFLDAIWPAKLLTNETLELRLIDRNTNRIRREFFRSAKELLERSQHIEGHDVYFGVSTRFGESGTKRDCYRVKCAWLDLDDCKVSDCNFDIKPDVVVDSGGGVHAYWLLKTPMLVRDERWLEIEAVNRGLCKKFNGDIAAIDVSRILRVPGTVNTKYIPLRDVRAYAL